MNENYPLISVIVPIYNAQEYLKKCLDSIINQSYTNLQIILVNDGSEDNSLEICNEYSKSDPRIFVINQVNSGVSTARNVGLDIVEGTFIGFVDSDDYIDEEMYETLLKAALTNHADITECGCVLVNKDGIEVGSTSLWNETINGSLQCAYQYLNHINTTNYIVNKLYKADTFSDLRFPEYHYSEDYYINSIAFLYCDRKVTIYDKLYFYLQIETSATHQIFQEKRLDTILAGEAVYKILQKDNQTYCALLSAAASYICENCVNLYSQIFYGKVESKDALIHKIIGSYRKYYRQAIRCTHRSTKLKLMFRLFYFCPHICIFIRKILLRGDNFNEKS